MARFYASIQGNRGEASRMGTPASGMTGHIRGWNVGVRVRCYVTSGGKDVCEVYSTGGSNGGAPEKLIARILED